MQVTFDLIVVATSLSSEERAESVKTEQALSQQIFEFSKTLLAEHGYLVAGGKSSNHWTTRDEALTFSPRKIHLRAGNPATSEKFWLCNTSYVSRKNITEDPDEVTCKSCLRVLEEEVGDGYVST